MPSRFWEMATGCLVFLLVQKNFRFIEILKKFNSNYIFIIILFTMFMPLSTTVQATIIINISTALLIICLRKETTLFNILTKDKVIYIGLISYSLYLWHWGVISISRWTIGIHWWSIPFQIILIFLLAKYSYCLIEKPLRKTSWAINRIRTLMKGIFTLIFSGLITLSFQSFFGAKIYLGKPNSITNKDWKSNRDWRKNIKSATESINGQKCFGENKYTSKQIDNLLRDCKIIDNKENKTVAFLGDSHALSLIDSQKIIYETGKNLIHYSYAGCPFPYPKYGLIPNGCSKFLKLSTEKILQDLESDDIIIIYNYHVSHLGDEKLIGSRHNIYDKNKKLPRDSNIKLKIYSESLREFAELAENKNIKIILVGATMRNPLIETYSKEWFRPFPPTFVLEEEYAYIKKFNEKLKKSVLGIKNLVFFDPLLSISCCKNIDEYNLHFRDGNHLSIFGANTLTKKIIPIISSF